jgi:hypothetical protein
MVPNSMVLRPQEREVIILRAALESLDELVSHELFDLTGTDPDTEVVFKDSIHQRLFNILLVDITSSLNARVVGTRGSTVEALVAITTNPQLGTPSDAAPLQTALTTIEEWLKHEVDVPVWFPTIESEVTLRLSRLEFIYICGNIAKHGFARLNLVATKIVKLLERAGVKTVLEDALSVMNDFNARFHEDVFTYHGTTLAEMLNNVRWGIHEYLVPEYRRSLVVIQEDTPRYSYTLPPDIRSTFGRDSYWQLMNTARSGPPVRRFVGTKWLKLRY